MFEYAYSHHPEEHAYKTSMQTMADLNVMRLYDLKLLAIKAISLNTLEYQDFNTEHTAVLMQMVKSKLNLEVFLK